MDDISEWEPQEFNGGRNGVEAQLWAFGSVEREFKRLWPRTTLLMCDELDSLIPRHTEWRLIFQSMNATLIAENNG